MIGVGFKNCRKITLESSFEESGFETALALGESLARHSKKQVVVFLYKKGCPKIKILKKIKLVNTGFLWLRRRIAIT